MLSGWSCHKELRLEAIHRVIVAQGLNPEIRLVDDRTIRFRVFNCTFKETALKNPASICQMHHMLLIGIFESFFGKDIQLIEENSIMSGCQSCDYTLLRLPE